MAGIIIGFLGLPTVGVVMGIFSGFEFVLLVAFMIIRRKAELFATINQYFFVLISFAGVLYFGGILNSCGLVFVGLVGALLTLFFLKPAQIRIIFTIYFLTVVAEAFLQSRLIPLPEITPKANLLLFVLHFLVVSFAIYTVLSFYITESIRIKEKEAKRLQELDTIKTHKELVDLLKGNLVVKSVPGKGSEFSVLLPVTNNVIETEIHESFKLGFKELLQEDVENNGCREPGIELPHLLIIEDNDDVVSYIRFVVGGEFLIDRAIDGEQGLNMAMKMIPDMILADIMMPKKDGFEVCKTLKEDFRTSHIPLILLSAKADKESHITGIGCGADAYISKPFDPKELMVRMRTLVETRKKLIAKYRTYAIATINDEAEPVNPDELFLRKLKEIMEVNFKDDSFDTNQLARNIGLSRVQLFRKLKALTGVSASHFIRFYRLSRAKEKIISTSENISEIAFGVGFKDPAYFTRAFNKEFGITPSSLRE